jgi:hypothetical protein
MLIGPPLGESRQIGEDLARIRVKDVRIVLVDEDALVVVMIVGVAADVRALVNEEHAFA